MSQIEVNSQIESNWSRRTKQIPLELPFEVAPAARGSESRKIPLCSFKKHLKPFQSEKRLMESVKKEGLLEWKLQGNEVDIFSFHRKEKETKAKKTVADFLGEDEETNLFKPKSPSKFDWKLPDFSEMKNIFDSPNQNTRKLQFSSRQKSNLNSRRVQNVRSDLVFPLFDEDFLLDFGKVEREKDISEEDSVHFALEWNEDLTRIMSKYLLSENVIKNPKYVQIWLDYSKVVEDPEEVLVYMHAKKIGELCPFFYARWMAVYVQRKEFLFAYDVTLISCSYN